MKANEFVKGKDFSTSKGLPEGKTIIDFETAEFGEKLFTDEKTGEERLSSQVALMVDGKKETYNLATSVMQKIKEAVEKKAAAVEINREGTGRQNTKYVTYALDTTGKVMKN